MKNAKKISKLKIIFFISLLPFSTLPKEILTPQLVPYTNLIIPIADTESKVDTKKIIYGYIKLDSYADTRQVVGLRSDQVLFYPTPRQIDPLGRDIYAHPQLNMSAIESRFGVALLGPKWDKVDTAGVMEIDFRGPTEETVHGLRLRYLFTKINFEHSNLIFGYFPHPLFIFECSPGVLSGNGGVPFENISRLPQIRYMYIKNKIEILAGAAEQTDFTSPGPIGLTSRYLARSCIPDLSLEIRYRGKHSLTGIVTNFKRLVPRLMTDKNFKTSEYINSFIVEGFFAYDFKYLSLRTKLSYAQNGSDHLLISGYGVKTLDPVTDCRTYTNTNCFRAWLELYSQFCEHKHEVGIFFGYTKNLGSSHELYVDPATKTPIIYNFLPTNPYLDYVARIAPRYIWSKDPLRIGAEIEWTRASSSANINCLPQLVPTPFTTIDVAQVLAFDQAAAAACSKLPRNIDVFGKPINPKITDNVRFLLSLFYVF